MSKLFADREDAARQLSALLRKYSEDHPLILGIPRGAMPMAEILVQELQGELGAVLVHKIPSPTNEEFAIGSVGLSGKTHANLDLARFGISEAYFQEEAARQLQRLKARQERFQLKAPDCQGKVVIIVDDGIATGATAIAAIHEVRAMKPKRLILAAGVIAREAARILRALVDELVVLDEPEMFFAVGQFFEDFSEVTDDDVEKIFLRYRDRERRVREAG